MSTRRCGFARSAGSRWQHAILLILVGLFPIGEASNPGPNVHFEDSFTMGTFNPSGLRNKAQYFRSHLSDGDLWTVTETHFFGKDVTRFRAGLRSANALHKYCLTDVASTRKSIMTQSSWKGVAVLSKHPTRAISNDLPQHIQDSGRALMFASLFGDTWISCAVMYGEPNSHSHPDYLRNNEHILHHLAAHVCNLCCGPRFISGDWNVEQDALPAFSILHRAGFRDLQDVALERWGLPIMATCKGRTRKDFMYISPELQELLIGVSVVHDVWPDHSILQGQFRNLTFAPPVRIWPMPHAFPWPGDFAQQVTWEVNDGDMTDGYRQLWATIEQSAVEACPHQVSSRMRGRAGRLHPKVVKNHGISPIKVGRQGDFQPEYHGPSFRHAQWVRQARRLQAYGRLAASSRTDLAIPRAESWGAILRAVGLMFLSVLGGILVTSKHGMPLRHALLHHQIAVWPMLCSIRFLLLSDTLKPCYVSRTNSMPSFAVIVIPTRFLWIFDLPWCQELIFCKDPLLPVLKRLTMIVDKSRLTSRVTLT